MPPVRNIVLLVILSVVTCGIWGIVWFFQLGSDIQMFRASARTLDSGHRGDEKPNPLTDFVLSIVTCGIWSIVVAYQWPQLLQEPLRARGQRVDTNLPVLSLVLALFGMHIVGMVLMQQLLNEQTTIDARGPSEFRSSP